MSKRTHYILHNSLAPKDASQWLRFAVYEDTLKVPLIMQFYAHAIYIECGAEFTVIKNLLGPSDVNGSATMGKYPEAPVFETFLTGIPLASTFFTVDGMCDALSHDVRLDKVLRGQLRHFFNTHGGELDRINITEQD